MSTGILIVTMLAPFLPDETEEASLAEINQTIIGTVRFCSFVVKFEDKFFSFVDVGRIFFCITRKEITCRILKGNLVSVDRIYFCFGRVCGFHVEANKEDKQTKNQN